MRQDRRLSRVLHALLHLEEMRDPATSDQLAAMLKTNPALVRRMMAGLREAGFVRSIRGHGGGWTLEVPLTDITLLAIYEALGKPALFAMGFADESPKCVLERAANTAISEALEASRRTFEEKLAATTLEDLAAERRAWLAAHPDWKPKLD